MIIGVFLVSLMRWKAVVDCITSHCQWSSVRSLCVCLGMLRCTTDCCRDCLISEFLNHRWPSGAGSSVGTGSSRSVASWSSRLACSQSPIYDHCLGRRRKAAQIPRKGRWYIRLPLPACPRILPHSRSGFFPKFPGSTGRVVEQLMGEDWLQRKSGDQFADLPGRIQEGYPNRSRPE